MRANLADFAFVHDDDLIYRLNRRQPVRDDQRRAPLHQSLDRIADEDFGFRINRTGRFIEYQDTRVEGQRPRKADQLLLPDRQASAALAQLRVIAFGQAFDELCRVHFARRVLQLLVADARLADPYVRGDVAGKQEHVLQNDAEIGAQLFQIHLADVDAVYENLAALNVIKPQEQIGNRRLPCPCMADESDALARLGDERHVFQNPVFIFVSEPDVAE